MTAGDRSPRVRRFAALRAWSAERGWHVLGTSADFSLHYPVPGLLGAGSARAELAVGGEWSGWPAQVALVAAQASSRPAPGRRAPRATVLLVTIDSGPVGSQFVVEPVGRDLEVVMLSRGGLSPGASLRLRESVESEVLRRGDHVAVGEVQALVARRLPHATCSLDPAPHLDLLVRLLEDIGGPAVGGPAPR
jgi:hypothetical protein